mmetsp:Transcript_10416/g.31372  ORF Transcript_10416/g.31372 Transcript_10416/m.31372 type:complete len:722 (+) Transcript_10416:235-2400(+)
MTDQKPLPWPEAANSPELRERAAKAKVLCVGAGGIGCELLKTLALSGFRDIQVIDLDTIETSNLNRQFLFRTRHVGSSKAAVAAEAVRRFAPQASIRSHQGNVKDTLYGVEFFAGFDLVLNGLDNMEARRHVNRLTLAAGTPLIESGTEGYLGQVTPHVKGYTECYECKPKRVPKTFPVCTIRNTPDKPIHCVVWAKELLFPRLFGRPEDVTDLDEQGTSPGASELGVATAVDAAESPLPNPDAAAATQQSALPGTEASAGPSPDVAAAAAAQAKKDKSFFLRRDREDSTAYARRIFTRVFTHDIQRVLRMEDLWQMREKPQPLDLDALSPAGTANGPEEPSRASVTPEASASVALGFSDAHTKLSLKELAALFLEATRRYLDYRPQEVGSAVFDKEDDLAVDFVAAASNLRGACYGIPPQSVFNAKGMAGNIVHAVATTNALISGLITLEALKLLAGARTACRNTIVLQHVSASRLVYPTATEGPSPSCVVCGTAQLHLSINTATTPLGALVDQVLKKRLALLSPTVSCGNFIYEEGPDLDPDEAAESAAHRTTALAALPGGGIGHGAIVDVGDQAQSFDAQIIVTHRDEWDEEEHPEAFILTGEVPAATADPSGETADKAADGGAEGSDSDLELLGSALAAPPTATTAKAPTAKRSREAETEDKGDETAAPAEKRARTTTPAGCGIGADAGVDDAVELADGIGAPLAAPDDDDLLVLRE